MSLSTGCRKLREINLESEAGQPGLKEREKEDGLFFSFSFGLLSL